MIRKHFLAPLLMSLAVVALAAFDVSAAQPAVDMAGVWLNPKANMRVHIGPCGPALCGNVVWLKYPDDPETGGPLTDKNNPDPAKRSRPLLGIQMITGLRPGRSAGEWIGQVYLPGQGKTYDTSFSMDGSNGLRIEGCMMAGVLCRAETWTRVN